ncbi:hypothetical protein BC940DRAFT_313851 [Gongronella butleri]|nr:hypothetical protein BC940DRAFT_313851 [Gongronella butleri]
MGTATRRFFFFVLFAHWPSPLFTSFLRTHAPSSPSVPPHPLIPRAPRQLFTCQCVRTIAPVPWAHSSSQGRPTSCNGRPASFS